MEIVTHSPRKMEQTQSSETSANNLHTPENNPKDNSQHLKPGESLKSRIYIFVGHICYLHGGQKYRDDSVGIAPCYELDVQGIDSGWEARLSAPVQTGP